MKKDFLNDEIKIDDDEKKAFLDFIDNLRNPSSLLAMLVSKKKEVSFEKAMVAYVILFVISTVVAKKKLEEERNKQKN